MEGFKSARILFFIAILFWVGCKSQTVEQKFEDFGFSGGLSLKRPSNWQADYVERTGTIVLRAEKGILNKDVVTIEIQPFSFSSPEEGVEANIDRLATHFYGDSLTIVQNPIKLEHENYEITTAIISIPTSPLSEDSNKNEEEIRDESLFRIVEVRAVKCTDNFAMIYTYASNNDQLNAEANEIVESIELKCSSD